MSLPSQELPLINRPLVAFFCSSVEQRPLTVELAVAKLPLVQQLVKTVEQLPITLSLSVLQLPLIPALLNFDCFLAWKIIDRGRHWESLLWNDSRFVASELPDLDTRARVVLSAVKRVLNGLKPSPFLLGTLQHAGKMRGAKGLLFSAINLSFRPCLHVEKRVVFQLYFRDVVGVELRPLAH